MLRCSQQARGQGSEAEREQLLAEEGRRRAVEMRLEEQRAKEEEARKLEYARQECELQLQVDLFFLKRKKKEKGREEARICEARVRVAIAG